MSDVPVNSTDASAPVEATVEVEAPVNQEATQNNPEQQSAAPVSSKKKLKLKIDDKEEDFEIDLSDEKELTRHLQMSKVAQKRMQESALIKKEAMNFIQQLKSDPVAVLSDKRLGVDFRQIAEEYLAKQLEEQMLSPEERKVREAERIIREKEELEKRSREEAEQAEMSRLQEHYQDHFQKVIIEQLQSGGVPKTKSTVKRMAELMKKNIDLGLDLEPKEIARLVQEDYKREIKELLESADEDSLLSMMGDPIANKIRKADLKRLKANQPKPFEQKKMSSTSSSDESTDKMTPEEFREHIRRKINS